MEIILNEALQRGVAVHQQGKLFEAANFYRQILVLQPYHPDASHNLGLIYFNDGKHSDATFLFKVSLSANRNIEQFWISLTNILVKRGKRKELDELVRRAIAIGIEPNITQNMCGLISSNSVTSSISNKEQTLSKHEIKNLLSQFGAGELLSAFQLATKLTKQFPSEPFFQNILGVISAKLGCHESALFYYHHAIGLNNQFAEAHFNMGISYAEVGRLNHAITSYKKTIENNSHYTDAFVNLGNLYFRQNKYLEALEYFRQAYRLKPDSRLTLSGLGNCYQKLNRKPEALKSFRSAILVQPHYESSYVNLASIFEKGAQNENPNHILKQAIILNPTLAEAHNNLGVSLSKFGCKTKALVALKKTALLDPQFPSAYGNLGFFHQNNPKTMESKGFFLRALAVNPNDQNAVHEVAVIANDAFEQIRSKKYLSEILQRYPLSAVHHNALANILYYSKNFSAAITSNIKAIILDPSKLFSYSTQGFLLLDFEEFKLATVAYERSVLLSPGNLDIHLNYSNALRAIGKYEDALEKLQWILQQRPDFIEAHNNIGITYKELGREDKAAKSFQACIDLDPHSSKAYRQLSSVYKFNKDDAYLDKIKSLLRKAYLSNEDRMHLSFASAKAWADLEQKNAALVHLRRANSIRSNIFDYKFEEDEKIFDFLLNRFSTRCIPKRRPKISSKPIKTPIFIVGMPRSGTTLVEQILSNHSEIYGGGELERLGRLINFQKYNDADYLDQLRHNYIQFLQKFDTNKPYVTDKMPLNFRWIGFILAAIPEAKIVHVKRGAAATCGSIFKTYFSSEGNHYAYNIKHLMKYYRLYRKLMFHWENLYPGSIYTLNYEQLTNNPGEEARRVLNYIGVKWEPNCINIRENSRPVKTASSSQVRQSIYSGSSNEWKRGVADPALELIDLEEIQFYKTSETTF